MSQAVVSDDTKAHLDLQSVHPVDIIFRVVLAGHVLSLTIHGYVCDVQVKSFVAEKSPCRVQL